MLLERVNSVCWSVLLIKYFILQVPGFNENQLDTTLHFVNSLRSSEDPTVSSLSMYHIVVCVSHCSNSMYHIVVCGWKGISLKVYEQKLLIETIVFDRNFTQYLLCCCCSFNSCNLLLRLFPQGSCCVLRRV